MRPVWVKRLSLLSVVSVLAATFGLAFAAPASATHFRFRDMTWRYDHALADGQGNVVELTMRIADRRSYYGGSMTTGSPFSAQVATGDGGSETLQGSVVAVNPVDDWFIAEVRGFHTYRGVGPYTAEWTSCCTLSSLQNSPDSSLRASTTVDMGDGNRASPTSLVSPIVQLPASGGMQTFRIPATDTDGDNVTFRLARQDEALVTQPPNLTIDPRTGIVTWDTAGQARGLWMATVVLSDGHGASTQNTFLVNLGGTASQPPTWVAPTPPDRTNIATEVASTTSFTVAAVDPEGDPVRITPLNAPPGLSCTEAPSAGRSDLSCSWSPTSTGSHLIAFDAQDSTGASAGLRSYRITGPRYVAFGDSYSSGEGALNAANYEEGTDGDTGGNGCRRASTAYSATVEADSTTPGDLQFVACSGARTWHFFEAQHPDTEEAQFDAAKLSTDVELVTLTIGGNDARFADILAECILGFDAIPWNHCSTDPEKSEEPVQDAFARMRGETPPHGGGEAKTRPLADIYSQILREAPRARVLVVGYPQFFRTGGTSFFTCSGVDKVDQQWVNDKVAEFNGLLEEEAHNLGLEFVPTSAAFEGHRLCEVGGGEDREWFRDLQFDADWPVLDPASFHPDDDGHQAMAKEILNVYANPPAAVTMTTGQRTIHEVIVDRLQELLSLVARWPGSDVEVTAISPSGRRYHRSAVPTETRHLLGPTHEIFQIPNPEPGTWTVELYGADLGADGEPVTFTSNTQPQWNNPPVPSVQHRVDGRTLHLDARDSNDPDGDTLVEYQWLLNDESGTFAELNGPVVDYTFDRTGDFGVSLRVRDARGKNGYAGLTQAVQIATVYDVTGPGQPLSPDEWNVVRAGRTVPVKWRLTKDNAPVAAATSFAGLSSRQVSCEDQVDQSQDVPADTAGASGLSYQGDGDWLFTWQTDRAWAGTCRIATVRYDDGSWLTVKLRFG